MAIPNLKTSVITRTPCCDIQDRESVDFMCGIKVCRTPPKLLNQERSTGKMLSTASDLLDISAYQDFLNMSVLDYDFLPKVPHIPENLPIRLQNFHPRKVSKDNCWEDLSIPK